MQKGNNKPVSLYHGSNVIVERPEIRVFGHYKDFGYGFYCTRIEHQARKWALTKKTNHIVTIYSYSETDGLNILKFPEMTDEWLDFVADCRRGKEHLWQEQLKEIFEGESLADAPPSRIKRSESLQAKCSQAFCLFFAFAFCFLWGSRSGSPW